MLYCIHVFAPDPEDAPEDARWYAGVEELADQAYGEGRTEAIARANAQAAALEHLADVLRSGTRGPLEAYESVVFLDAWNLGDI